MVGPLEKFPKAYSVNSTCVPLVAFSSCFNTVKTALNILRFPIHFHPVCVPRYRPYHKVTKFTNWDKAIKFKHHCFLRQRRVSKMYASAHLKKLLADTYCRKLSLCCRISASFGLRSQIEDTMISLKPQSSSVLIGIRHCSTSDNSLNYYLELTTHTADTQILVTKFPLFTFHRACSVDTSCLCQPFC